jgi:hypothetical protein
MTIDSLLLQVEPTADCGRYDSLLSSWAVMSIDNLSQLKALKLFGMATALVEIWAETPGNLQQLFK